jgi:uncharacterized membrane protein
VLTTIHGAHPLAGLLLLLVVASLVAIAVVAVLRLTRSGSGSAAADRPGPPGPPPADPALAELRLRYARGEVPADEYWQRVANLGYQVPPGVGAVNGPRG